MKWDPKTYSKLNAEMTKGFGQMMRGIILSVLPEEECVAWPLAAVRAVRAAEAEVAAQKKPETNAQTSKDILGDVWDEHLRTLHVQRKWLSPISNSVFPHCTPTEVCIADPWSKDHVLIIPRETAEKILVLGCPAPTPPNKEELQQIRGEWQAGKWIESLPRQPN
jgi:hypothetical protein